MDFETAKKNLTLQEKAALVSGTDFMYTNPVPRLDIPAVSMADGPHGLRKQTGKLDNGVSMSEPATAFPTAVCTASGWNEENLYKMGAAIAEECLHYGVDLLLGPGVNIKRNPLCGRNFEYFSEDPYLAGKMAAAEVNGVQSKGVGVSVKHFALNNSENYRFLGNSICDMRAMREIYLKPFEIVVKESAPHTLMCAYNKINGVYCSENAWLLNDVLRQEWGFQGAVMTDWGATHDRVKGLAAGLDLEMPGDTHICRKRILDSVKDGNLPEDILDRSATRVLSLVSRYQKNEKIKADFEAHHALAAEIAEDCAVLMKNDGVLPLKKDERFCVLGELFKKMRYQGSGSSMINATKVVPPYRVFDERKINYVYERGYTENKTEIQPELIAAAIKKTADCDKILIFAGLTDHLESEGGDRENMRLPESQLALIDAAIQTGKKVVVVLFGGSVVKLPFAEKAGAILNMFLPGQNGGTATANLLFGDKTPCGKLAETWVKEYVDVPFGAEFGKGVNEVYKESVFVGYRYYQTAKKQVRYPFGFGLSYTRFDYKNMQVVKDENTVFVSCEVANIGGFDGAEIVQLYVKEPTMSAFKPEKALRAFAKVYLKAGECQKVTLSFKKEDLRYYNAKENRWILEGGEYEIQLCSDCETVKLSETIGIEGPCAPYSEEIAKVYGACDLSAVSDAVFEKMSGMKIPALPPKKPITLESKFTDLQQTFMGKILYKAVLSVAIRQLKQAKKLPEGAERDNKIKGAFFLKRIFESNTLLTMSMSAGHSFPYNFAEGFVHLANGRLIKGIKCFCTKIKAPKLPKEEK